MQKDFMSMAQQAQGQQPEQPQGQASAQDVFKNLKETLVELQLVKANELDNEIQELAELILAGDEAAIEENKLFQALQEAIKQVEKGVMDEQAQGAEPQQAQAEPAATKDFASMMPPAGGGMGGR